LYEGNGGTQNVVCNLSWEDEDKFWNFQVSISPIFFEQLLQAQTPKAQKDTDNFPEI
jgi:hypothetical protein